MFLLLECINLTPRSCCSTQIKNVSIFTNYGPYNRDICHYNRIYVSGFWSESCKDIEEAYDNDLSASLILCAEA